MNIPRHFETALRDASVIRTMLDDLNTTIQILNVDITTEEERVRVFDRAHATYPILARTLAARRDNLQDTVAVLERRLAAINVPLSELIAA
jgi:hypothetical protein